MDFSLLSLDANVMKKTGRILIVAELAREYGFKDVGGMCSVCTFIQIRCTLLRVSVLFWMNFVAMFVV